MCSVGTGAAVVGHDWCAALAWAVARSAPDRVAKLVVASVGRPLAGAAAGLPNGSAPCNAVVPVPGHGRAGVSRGRLGVLSPLGLGRGPAGAGPRPGPGRSPTCPAGCARSGPDLVPGQQRPGQVRHQQPNAGAGPGSCRPTMDGVVQRRLPLPEAQTTGSGRFVAGPSRYERLDGVDHWVPVHAPERLNELLLDFLG